MQHRKTLFVSGVARSGTTALVNVLNQHPRILVGTERYFRETRNETLEPEMFQREAFLFPNRDLSESQGFHLQGSELIQKFNRSIIVGDKFPGLFRHFDHVFEKFPDAIHLYIFRNPFSVVESYEARKERENDKWSRGWRMGLEEWNESLRRVADLPQERLERLVFLPYEEVLSSTERMNLLYTALGLHHLPEASLNPITAAFRHLASRAGKRREKIRREVARHSDWDAYGRLSDLADQQLTLMQQRVAAEVGQRLAGE